MSDTKYFLKIVEIERVKNIRDLRVIYDEKIRFQDHIDVIVNKAKRFLAIGKRLCNDIGDRNLLLKINAHTFDPLWNIVHKDGQITSSMYAIHLKNTISRLSAGLFNLR